MAKSNKLRTGPQQEAFHREKQGDIGGKEGNTGTMVEEVDSGR